MNYQDKENLMKLTEMQKEMFDARSLLLKCHAREKKKLETIDLDFVLFKQ